MMRLKINQDTNKNRDMKEKVNDGLTIGLITVVLNVSPIITPKFTWSAIFSVFTVLINIRYFLSITPLKAKGILNIFLLIFLLYGCSAPPAMKHISGEKYLIVNGDDLCLDDKTDQAIITAYKNGILTSTSAFINLPGSVEKLKRIHNENPDLPIGLHLNLTFGKSVLNKDQVQGLLDNNGNFYDIDNILPHLADMSFNEVRAELNAQVELFISTGIPVDHLDSHHHIVALFTPFFQIVRELAIKYNLPVRNPVPISIYNSIKLNVQGGGKSASLRKLILFGIAHPFKSIPLMSKIGPEAFIEQERIMKTTGIKSPDWFIDCFYGNATYECFISILSQLPDGVSEIMCHPGISNDLIILSNKTIHKDLDSLNIKLVNYKHL